MTDTGWKPGYYLLDEPPIDMRVLHQDVIQSLSDEYDQDIIDSMIQVKKVQETVDLAIHKMLKSLH